MISTAEHQLDTKPSDGPLSRRVQMQRACDELNDAIDDGNMGGIVAKHQALISLYYNDVQDQAKQSFVTARSAARIGFLVLIAVLVYALIFDALGRLRIIDPLTTTGDDTSLTIAKIGVVSGALIEFIAAVAFWLYTRGAKQFSAFHICLERTHRYLLAYKIADQMETGKDQAFSALACIMANAPMITRNDVDSIASNRSTQVERETTAVATVASSPTAA
jgi:hypothetical protein